MNASIELVLHPDVELVPVERMPAALVGSLGARPGEVAIGRRYARSHSIMVDAATAALVGLFRRPTSVVDAAVAMALTLGEDGDRMLDHVVEVTRRLAQGGLMVEADQEVVPVVPRLAPGDRWRGFGIEACVRLTEDTEIYRARGRTRVAIKLGRDAAGASRRAQLRREGGVLAALRGTAAVERVEAGEDPLGPYVVTTWLEGIPVTTAGRRCGDEADIAARLPLVLDVLRAYATVHARGVLHGDVHPGNVIVTDQGVRLVDFGAAAGGSGSQPVLPRTGLPYFMEPEWAQAARAGREAPRVSVAAELHALGALCFLVLTGAHYAPFRVEREAMLAQICEHPPRSFRDLGLRPWPAVEAALGRSLAKDPGERFESVAALLDAMVRASEERPSQSQSKSPSLSQSQSQSPSPSPSVSIVEAPTAPPELAGPLRRYAGLDAFDAEPIATPRGSLAHGMAGIAYALHRAALLREEPALLAGADRWITRAAASTDDPECFRFSDAGSGPREPGAGSLFHGLAGVRWVEALVAGALGDRAACRRAVAGFVECAAAPGEDYDLVLGRPGMLLGVARLRATVEPAGLDPATLDRLDRLGRDRLTELTALCEGPAIEDQPRIPYLGFAHGWAGILYAALTWCQVSATPVPPAVVARLHALASWGVPTGDAITWPRGPGFRGTPWPGWCHGSAGHVLLWARAATVLGGTRWRALAVAAGLHTWDYPRQANETLCCGMAGRAFALLELRGLTGDDVWLERARTLAAPTKTTPDPHACPHALAKGSLATGLLALELRHPDTAAMPVFGLSAI